MSLHWILDENGEPVPTEDLLKWSRFLRTEKDRMIIRTTDVSRGAFGPMIVRTKFCAIDKNFGKKPPKVYESTIIGGPYDDRFRRYTTKFEALQGHDRLVEALRDLFIGPTSNQQGVDTLLDVGW